MNVFTEQHEQPAMQALAGPTALGSRAGSGSVAQLELIQRLQELEAQAARACQDDMRQLREQHPLWLFHFEDAEADTADADALIDLLVSAPNAFAKGLIFGKFTLRMQLAAITSRSF
jgi:hypothetical protein